MDAAYLYTWAAYAHLRREGGCAHCSSNQATPFPPFNAAEYCHGVNFSSRGGTGGKAWNLPVAAFGDTAVLRTAYLPRFVRGYCLAML